MIHLKECKNSEDRLLFKDTINKHHSYVKHKLTPTRRIDFLIYENESNNLIGAIGLNSATLNLGERDKLLKLNNRNKKKRLLNIANNYRFALIKDNITIQNAGSQILKSLRNDGARAWKRKYGNKLIGIETFVKPPWTGSVYKADNWFSLGETRGFSAHRFPTELVDKKYREKYLSEFNKKFKTTNGVKYRKAQKKLIFFKPLVKKMDGQFREYAQINQLNG